MVRPSEPGLLTRRLPPIRPKPTPADRLDACLYFYVWEARSSPNRPLVIRRSYGQLQSVPASRPFPRMEGLQPPGESSFAAYIEIDSRSDRSAS
jgi:hypothetical protein